MRVRFAPSPTGFLHVGNARTAIINYLIARKEGCGFTLRIEDTDRERSTRESEASIIDDLRWLGLSWDEGPDTGGDHGPYRQSERDHIYRRYTEQLVVDGNAYYCYCTPEEIEEVRKKVEAENIPYQCMKGCHHLDNAGCRDLEAEGRTPAVRFRVPRGELVTVNDTIRGKVQFNSDNIGGDFIIVRSDGGPIYNYLVVIDDHLMGVTHVIRGEDHLSNTPKQVLIAKALGFESPVYAHHPLILGEDRTKLSKRHGITSVSLYRDQGYLPEAMVNYLAMLGWAADDDAEILPLDEIVRQVSLDRLGKSASIFSFTKLRWMNGQYIRSMDAERAVSLFTPHLEKAGYPLAGLPAERVSGIVDILRGYCEVLTDIGALAGIFLDTEPAPDGDADAMLREPYARDVIAAATAALSGGISAGDFTEKLIPFIKDNAGQKGKQLFMPLRAMLTGRLKGPELDRALPLIGFTLVEKRIRHAAQKYGG